MGFSIFEAWKKKETFLVLFLLVKVSVIEYRMF